MITFPQYMKYIKFTCDEELERLGEFLYSMDNNYDCSGDKYYIAYPDSNCPPDIEHVTKMLQGRDMKKDFEIMERDDPESEELYQELRNLILYT